MRFRPLFILAAAVLAVAAFPVPPAGAQQGDTPFPPHHAVANVHYVGSRMLASYLITTDAGHALINSCFPETVPLIKASVEKLGFKFEDIRLLLNSHAHNDHVAGNALVRRLTKARVLIMEGDEEIVRTGGRGDFQYDSTWEPCPVDRVLRDGEEVKLGGTVLTARKTPGHTRGCTTWTMSATEKGRDYRVVIIGSPNVNPGYKLVGNEKYPNIARDYARTFEVLKSLPCDIFLGAHGDYYRMTEKHARLGGGGINPFNDPLGYRQYVEDREKAFQTALASQQGTK